MTTQSVKTQIINLFGDSKTEKSSAVKQKGMDTDFSSVMNSNLKTKSTSEKESSTVKEDSAVKETSTVEEKDSKREQKVTDNIKDTGGKGGKDMKTGNGDESVQSNDVLKSDYQQDSKGKDVPPDLNNIYVNIQNLLAMLQNTVQSSLGITEEELESAMETLGFTATDLLNPDNLKQLVLQINGTEDISEVLTDENLADTMKQLVQRVEDLKSGQNIPLSQEEVTEIMNRLQETDLTNTQAASLKTVPENADQDLSGVKSTSADGQSPIALEIHKVQDAETKGNDSFTSSSDSRKTDVKTSSPVEMFIQNLAVKGNEADLNFTEQIANVRQVQDIANQIIERIKIMIKPEQTSMELQLNPESLGKINLSVVAKDGIMTAHFTAQNELTKEAIESQMQVLKDNLNNQGLKVETIEVTVSNFSFDQSSMASGGNENGQQNRSANRNLNVPEADIYSDLGGNEIQDIDLPGQSGSSIDYTA